MSDRLPPRDAASGPMNGEHSPEQATPIWRPDRAHLNTSTIARFGRFAAERNGLDRFADYDQLWRWSVTELPDFWASIWEYFEVAPGPAPDDVLADDRMPGASWFPGTRLNYAEYALRQRPGRSDDDVAVTEIREDGRTTTMTWRALRERVAAVSGWLRDQGVRPGDRVVGYLPNATPALVAFLASAAVGAVWAMCSQEYSAAGAASRFAQLEPVVLFAGDGYSWNGKPHDRRRDRAELRALLPTVRVAVDVPYLEPAGDGAADTDSPEHSVAWADVLGTDAAPAYDPVEFSDALWVLFSSGTTGLPKGLVHGHGGVLLEHLKFLALHLGVGPGRPLFWYSSTSWMMWNVVASGLLVGAPVVLYDGSATHPGPERLWSIAAEHGVAVLGVSPGLLTACRKADVRPSRDNDLAALDMLAVTGSPLPADLYHWVADAAGPQIQVAASSGGTDVVTAFAAGAPCLPVWPGELSARCLGVALAAWDPDGNELVGQVGELVVTRPMPSMPVRMWGDEDGERYRSSYFDVYPGIWRHGDWVELTDHGSLVISGRSDATLNRSGVRLGSADIYRVVDPMPELDETLIVGVELGDGGYWLVLFVVLAEGHTLSDELVARINHTLRSEASPRHVPDDVIAVPALPHTRTGKKLEVPVKRLIQGHPLSSVVSGGAVDNIEALAQFAAYAQVRPGSARTPAGRAEATPP